MNFNIFSNFFVNTFLMPLALRSCALAQNDFDSEKKMLFFPLFFYLLSFCERSEQGCKRQNYRVITTTVHSFQFLQVIIWWTESGGPYPQRVGRHDARQGTIE